MTIKKLLFSSIILGNITLNIFGNETDKSQKNMPSVTIEIKNLPQKEHQPRLLKLCPTLEKACDERWKTTNKTPKGDALKKLRAKQDNVCLFMNLFSKVSPIVKSQMNEKALEAFPYLKTEEKRKIAEEISNCPTKLTNFTPSTNHRNGIYYHKETDTLQVVETSENVITCKNKERGYEFNLFGAGSDQELCDAAQKELEKYYRKIAKAE